jgi:hypothetical protein
MSPTSSTFLSFSPTSSRFHSLSPTSDRFHPLSTDVNHFLPRLLHWRHFHLYPIDSTPFYLSHPLPADFIHFHPRPFTSTGVHSVSHSFTHLTHTDPVYSTLSHLRTYQRFPETGTRYWETVFLILIATSKSKVSVVLTILKRYSVWSLAGKIKRPRWYFAHLLRHHISLAEINCTPSFRQLVI